MASTIAIREHEEIYRGEETFRGDKVYLSPKAYDNLFDSIVDEKSGADISKVLSIHSKKRHEYIKASKYVGIIQTSDGTTIEILPKIYSVPLGDSESADASICSVEESKQIFLNMLQHFKDENGVSFQVASLDAKSNFPILEAYIHMYLQEMERLIRSGIKKNYSLVEETSNCLKGKLVIQKQVVQECIDKTKFVIKHNKFQENIPQNRILVTTLKKLKGISHNPANGQMIKEFLAVLDGIPVSTNISKDLQFANKSNRLFSNYRKLIEWGALFLSEKGIVTFSGKYINQSFLFPADKLFESFIAFLAKKYLSNDFMVNAQDKRYYLIEDHAGHKMFNLRPDLYLERRDSSREDLPERIIIDTKWKRLDQNNHKGYNIEQQDLYQMFAYGKKYQKEGTIPKMVLLYPYCDTFTTSLSTFVYDMNIEENGLQVIVSSFNLADKNNYESMFIELIRTIGQSQSIKEMLQEAELR